MSSDQPARAPSRLLRAKRYFGLDRSYQRPTGPSAEDIARERSWLLSQGVAIGPDDDVFEVSARLHAQRQDRVQVDDTEEAES